MPRYENPNFPELDAELQDVWEAFLKELAEVYETDIQPSALNMSWNLVRSRIIDAIRVTAHQRFSDWYGKGKRRNSEPAVGADSAGGMRS